MTGFRNSILRPFGFANKADAGEPSPGPIEAEHMQEECRYALPGTGTHD